MVRHIIKLTKEVTMTMTYLQYLANKKKLAQQNQDISEDLIKGLNNIGNLSRGVVPNAGTEGDLAFNLASQYLPIQRANQREQKKLDETYKHENRDQDSHGLISNLTHGLFNFFGKIFHL